MYTTDLRFNGSYRNTSTSNETALSDQKGKGKPSSPAIGEESSPLILSKNEDGYTSEKDLSNVSTKSSVSAEAEKCKGSVFFNKDIQQVESSSRASDIFKASYTSSNRGAVALGITGGIIGLIHGPSGAMLGTSIGSSIGTHSGALIGALQEYSKPLPVEEVTHTNPEEDFHPDAETNPFLGHVIQVVDHAGHHAAMGSIGVGIAALLTSLATGNPLPVAVHVAGIYSGAAWMFGLTTGSTSWIRQKMQHSADVLQREQKFSPGDIELTRIFHPSLLRKPGTPMAAPLDLNFDQDSMDSYSPDQNSSSALTHQPSLLSRRESDEISGLTTWKAAEAPSDKKIEPQTEL